MKTATKQLLTACALMFGGGGGITLNAWAVGEWKKASVSQNAFAGDEFSCNVICPTLSSTAFFQFEGFLPSRSDGMMFCINARYNDNQIALSLPPELSTQTYEIKIHITAFANGKQFEDTILAQIGNEPLVITLPPQLLATTQAAEIDALVAAEKQSIREGWTECAGVDYSELEHSIKVYPRSCPSLRENAFILCKPIIDPTTYDVLQAGKGHITISYKGENIAIDLALPPELRGKTYPIFVNCFDEKNGKIKKMGNTEIGHGQPVVFTIPADMLEVRPSPADVNP